MILRALAILFVIAGFASPAAAQERVTVDLTRSASGRVFMVASRGYFQAKGLDLQMRAFPSGDQALQAVAGSALDFGLADFAAQGIYARQRHLEAARCRTAKSMLPSCRRNTRATS